MTTDTTGNEECSGGPRGSWDAMSPDLCAIFERTFHGGRAAAAIVHDDSKTFIPNRALVDALNERGIVTSAFQSALSLTLKPLEIAPESATVDGSAAWFGPLVDDAGPAPEIGTLAVRRLKLDEESSCLLVELLETDLVADRRRIEATQTRDPLTWLPNRATGLDRLGQAIELGRRMKGTAANDGQLTAVAIIDIRNFKGVNDEFGTETADAALVQVGKLVQETVRTYDTVARSHGDQFMVVLPSVRANQDMAVVCEKILDVFRGGIPVEGHVIQLDVSIGLSVCPADGETPATLLRGAEIALLEAKAEWGSSYKFCNPEIAAQASRRTQVERGLRQALTNDEFYLHYQPIWCSRSDRVLGVETLIRWRNDGLGDVSPAEFIPIAEDTNDILDIGHFVLNECCRAAATWAPAMALPYISVNVSGKQLENEDFASFVHHVLAKTGLAPAILQLELTETAVLNISGHVENQLRALNAMGVSLAIDDFGTGYSSLSRLRDIQFNCLKVDQSFIKNLEDGNNVTQMLSAINALAKGLGLRTVCEGVESEVQKTVIRAQDFDLMQGFHLARPMSANHLCHLLAA